MDKEKISEEMWVATLKMLHDISDEFSDEFGDAINGVRGDIDNRVANAMNKEWDENKRSSVVDDIMTGLLLMEFAEILLGQPEDIRKSVLKTCLLNVTAFLDDYETQSGNLDKPTQE